MNNIHSKITRMVKYSRELSVVPEESYSRHTTIPNSSAVCVLKCAAQCKVWEVTEGVSTDGEDRCGVKPDVRERAWGQISAFSTSHLRQATVNDLISQVIWGKIWLCVEDVRELIKKKIKNLIELN